MATPTLHELFMESLNFNVVWVDVINASHLSGVVEHRLFNNPNAVFFDVELLSTY